MERFRSHLSLWLATLASLLLHVAVLLPWLHATLSGDAGATSLTPISTPAVEIEPPPPAEPQLGIEANTPSSLTWIGYEEYEEHLARLAEIEQAAFTQSEAGVQIPAPAPDALTQQLAELPAEPTPAMEQPTNVANETAAETTTEALTADAMTDPKSTQQDVESTLPAPDPASEPAAESAPAPSDEPSRAAPLAPPRLSLLPLTRVHDAAVPKPLDLDADGTDGSSEATMPIPEGEADRTTSTRADTAEDIGADSGSDSSAQDAQHAADAATKSPREPAERGQPNESPEPAQEPSPTPPPSPQGDEPGERSDRESDATSVIDAKPDNWKLGKPLAASGVELRPQRPDFTLLQRLTLSPCSPLVEIRFGPDGRPREAHVLESSRSESVDSAVKSSLYRWRANGEAINTLKEDQTFRVVIRLVLNPYCP